MQTFLTRSLFLLLCLAAFRPAAAREITVFLAEEHVSIQLGLAALRETAARYDLFVRQVSSEQAATLRLRILPGMAPEGFELVALRKPQTWQLSAGDATGAMYGLFDLAEELQMKGGAWQPEARRQAPHLAFRAIKFNLPWSPYREGTQMDLHSDVCRDLAFWERYLDMMARNRFNVLSLWSRHPFPFLVRPHNFPEACPFDDRELAEWQAFWKGLFRMAKQRGIETYLVNWNIVVSPGLAEAYGVKELNDTSELVRRYTREVVTQVIDEYEDLTGLGVTLADWMDNFGADQHMTAKDREDWIEDTFVRGMKAAKRPVKFIHRSVLAGSPAEMQRVIDDANFPDRVHVEIKFNWSHGHSTPVLAMTHDYHSGAIDAQFWDPLPENYRIQWMIRNEDFFILRWGEPDFIRAHIAENTHEYVSGYFVGSEGYIPAADYTHLAPSHQTWQYAFEKQWLFYLLWGRLLYDPQTPDARFEAAFEARYGAGTGKNLLEAYRRASRMPLRLASFHAATWDYTLYSEGFLAPFGARGHYDGHSAFISIDELIDHAVLDPAYWDIPRYVAALEAGTSVPEGIITPADLADLLDEDALIAVRRVEDMRREMGNARGALRCEWADLETWALLSHYFAAKLRAGIALHRFRRSGDRSFQDAAIVLLTDCLSYWEQLSALTASHYREAPYLGEALSNRSVTGWTDARDFSWSKYLVEVRRDLEIARRAGEE